MIVVRDQNGKLNVAAHNENVVFCRNCPGGFEDGFADIIIDRNGFTIRNTVGKSDRTIFKYSFAYSRGAKTWRLDKFEKTDYTFSPIACGRGNIARRETSPESISPISIRRN